MKQAWIVPALVLALAPPAAAEADPEFAALCERLSAPDTPFFSAGTADELRLTIAAGTPGDTVQLVLQGQLGYELMRTGKPVEAVEVLSDAVRSLAARDTVDPRLAIELNYNLGLAHLQVGEAQNCIENHRATSCILPIRPEAVHQTPTPAARAADAFRRVLALKPDHATAQWLLNLAETLAGNYPQGVEEGLRWSLPAPADTSSPIWLDRAGDLGVAPSDLAGGAIVDDFDGDGLLDIISSTWDPCGAFKAFRNLGPGFEDVSERWGLNRQLGSLTLRQADYDNDGDLDLLALRGAWMGEYGKIRNSLLRNELNEPSGRFVDVTAEAGIAFPAFPTQAAGWADFDLDGDLDLFIGNEATASAVDPLQLMGREGNPFPSQLFRNNGDGTFTDIARRAGVVNRRYTKGCAWGDYDGDGDPDLYLSNIGPNRLFRNNGDSTFTDVADTLGVSEPAQGSFATWFFDHDNDGDLDLFVASYSAPVRQVAAGYLGRPTSGGHPVLYRNDGGRFTDISSQAGLLQPQLVMGADFGDLDGDGWLDMYLGTGVPDFDALLPNALYRNVAGERFEDITFSSGLGHLQKGHSVAFADVDNDGQQEIYEQLGGAHLFDKYSNALFDAAGRDAGWVTLRLRGVTSNRQAVGARIHVVVTTDEGPRSIFRTVGFGSSFGGSSLQEEIGLGAARAIEWIEILWPGARNAQRYEDVVPNAAYRAVEGVSELQRIELPSFDLGALEPAGLTAHDH